MVVQVRMKEHIVESKPKLLCARWGGGQGREGDMLLRSAASGQGLMPGGARGVGMPRKCS